MKTHFSLRKCLIGLILLSMYACEKDKPANNFDLLTNGSSKVWYLKRIIPNSNGPNCLYVYQMTNINLCQMENILSTIWVLFLQTIWDNYMLR